MTFANKVILITGGASGIGQAACLAFARAGAHVAVADRQFDGAQATAKMIADNDGRAIAIACDVTRAVDCETMVAQTVAAFGRLDVAFNNAGVGGVLSSVADQREEDWDRTLAVNLKGVWLCMKYEIPALIAAGGGAIVNNASLAGLIGFRNAAAYSASKHGVIGLTRSAALEYARQNIRVNAVCPGFTDTPMVSTMHDISPRILEGTLAISPMRRLGTPDEIAAAVLWLASDAASFVTGQALAVDGGMSAT
jgi:NAD(P)-dependent dehydrogenase (short-subunit alcohol dehydrogenase family)